jgi:hypothetical protein
MTSPDHVTVASLHGALDRLNEVEELLGPMTFPFTAAKPVRRLGFLASEMRALLTDLLRPETRLLPVAHREVSAELSAAR